MAPKLFITDFDGTLLTDDKTIDPIDIQALAQLQKKNVVTAIATGRSLYSFEKALKALDMKNAFDSLSMDYLIFSTGAGILDCKTNQIIFKQSILGPDVKTIADYLIGQKMDYMILNAIPDTRYFLYQSFGQDNPDFYRRISLYQKFATKLSDSFQSHEPGTEVLAILPREKGIQMVESVKTALPGFSIIQATSPLDHQSVWIEIFHKDVSKSKTTAFLSDKIGVTQEDVISVGNDYNDQDLLDWSNKSFIVQNAPEELRQKYTAVASNNRCGVSDAVKLSGALG